MYMQLARYYRWWFQTPGHVFQGESTSIYPCWTFPNGPKGLGGVAGGGNESQRRVDNNQTLGSWKLAKVGGYFFPQRWWSQIQTFFFGVGHNWCNEFFSPCNLFGIFSGDISWGCFGRGGRLPKGFPQEPNAGGSSETSEVSQLEMFSLSPLQVVMFCCFFLGVGGWGDIFLVVKNQETLFCLVGSF